MKESRLFAVATRLRPELKGLDGVALAGNLIDMGQLLYAWPLALLAMIWLVLWTDLAVLRQHGLLLTVLLVFHFLFDYFNFQIQLEVLPGIFASATGTMDVLIIWSAALLVGPTALWLIVLVELGMYGYRQWQGKTGDMRWFQFRAFVDPLAYELLPGLVGLWLYGRFGGIIPFPGLNSASLLPAIIATLATFLSLILIFLPLNRFIARSTATLGEVGNADSRAMFRFLLISGSLPGLVYPFALLAAGLYAVSGVGIYLFFVIGVLLASFLANRLSRAVARHEQRTREMTALEALGRAIIAAPPDAATLPELLSVHVPRMLSLNLRVLIWRLPGEILYANPEKDGRYYVEQANQKIQAGEQAYYYFRDVWEPEALAGKIDQEGLAVPIRDEAGSHLGGIYLVQRRDQGAVRDYLTGLQSLAAQVASAVRRAEVYQQTLTHEKLAQELEVAGRIQATFLPSTVPDIPGWEIAAMLQPARQTSGDFYDFMELGNGRFGILVADVADKGTGAALYMALSRTLIRTYAMQYPDAPEEALRLANERILADTESDQFVTVFYAVLDTANGTMTYANGGHNPAFLLGGTGRDPQSLSKTGIPLGMFEGMAWQQQTVDVVAGEILVLYSDGVTEAQDAEGNEFGEKRLLAALQGESAEGMVTAVLTAIHDFVGDAPQFDDVTLVIAAKQK